MTSSAELRRRFLDYFRKHDHEIVPSSSLVPVNDPTLLFTNAGMVQFKDLFLGREQRAYARAATVQRCLRAGGKHNDLENVGYTARHHTFFEMLGNFSFGDYFKREAIGYAWEFLTRELKLPEKKLWVTVYADDDEAADIWLNEIGVDKARFVRISGQDNFWSMGDTGPCGPCSEIFYDHGAKIPGGPPGSPDADGDRYVEIWNLVFTQYDRAADGTLNPLPRPSVDTGMGLERLAAVYQGVHDNYDTDVLGFLVAAAAKLTDTEDTRNSSLRVLADHIRACAFLIVDGVLPSNEGRGYVLRRIIRRAIRHGYKLGMTDPFFYELVEPLCEKMGDAYPELAKGKDLVMRAMRQEEERFAETLHQGMAILSHEIAHIKTDVIPGAVVFKLYDTYGFPVDLTADVAREHDLAVDMPGFEQAMEQQRERARGASTFKAQIHAQPADEAVKDAEFSGYDTTEDQAVVTALYAGDKAVPSLKAGDDGTVFLDRTPFYAESGGQVGDTGWLRSSDAEFEVRDTQALHAHVGRLKHGTLKVGDPVHGQVDQARRAATALNHSATHLLHAALRKVLGEHVAQKGSLVAPDRLRFDFSHFEPLTSEQIQTVEDLVNGQIRANAPVETQVLPLQEALAAGAMAFFGEKYGEHVRVLRMGDFSIELCGGTHVRRAGDIGLFKIIAETGVAAGVRRIEAVTGQGALDWVRDGERRLAFIAGLVKGGREDLDDKVKQILERTRRLEKELEQVKAKAASEAGSDLASQAQDIHGTRVLATLLDGVDPKSLRATLDQLKSKLGSAVIVLASASGGKVSLVAGVTKDRTGTIDATELVNQVALKVGGKGGGRPDMAQAGGNNPAALPEALAGVLPWIRTKLEQGRA
jgi:alanyl-tRNA synthetase